MTETPTPRQVARAFFDADLFASAEWPPLIWFPNFLHTDTADALFTRCAESLDWEAREVNFGGRRVPVPRLIAWYGEEAYRYGGFTHAPAALPDFLLGLAEQLSVLAAHHLGAVPRFNSVLLNHYRHGQDSMSFHSDNEAQLGPEPVIASLSLGATRTFQFRRRGLRLRLDGRLTHGSLLIMHGRCQRDWEHAIPKEACDGARINLTFRHTAPLRAGPLRLTGDATSR